MVNHAWILALAAAWLQMESPDGDGASLEMSRIDGVTGQLAHTPGNAANDQAARALILVLIWWWSCAKYRANIARIGLKVRKLADARFHPTFPPDSRLVLDLPGFWLGACLCQIDHLPTRAGILHN